MAIMRPVAGACWLPSVTQPSSRPNPRCHLRGTPQEKVSWNSALSQTCLKSLGWFFFQAFSVWRGVVICWLITSLSVMWLIQRVVIWGERWGEGSEHDTCMWKIKTLLSAVLFLKLELTMRRERAVCSYLLLNTVWVWINQLILLSYFFMCKMKMIVTFFTELLGGLNIE